MSHPNPPEPPAAAPGAPEEPKVVRTLEDFAAHAESINKKVQEVSDLPIPGMGPSWHLEGMVKEKKSGSGFFGIFGKRDIDPNEIAELRKAAQVQPGQTQGKLAKLKKQFPGNPELLMLSAVCTHGNMMNSASGKQLEGFKSAARDAARCLLSNGIYNAENFIKIYYMMLDRYKREQIKVFEEVRTDPRLDSLKHKMTLEMRLIDYLASDRKKNLNILAHLKKKLKSSSYSQYFDFFALAKACQLVSDGQGKETLEFCSAAEFIAYVYALAVAFAKIPILNPLTDRILEIIPPKNLNLALRRVSIASVRHFGQFRIATILGEREKMKKAGQIIYQENLNMVKKMETMALYQVYETDPFFNVGFVAELTAGLYEAKDQARMVQNAIAAMETVIKKDMSKNHIFTDSARNHTHKLSALMPNSEEAEANKGRFSAPASDQPNGPGDLGDFE